VDLPALQAFAKVVHAGSFTAAAAALGTDKARLSRVIAALERELGTRLLERSTRSLRLTDSGRAVHERALGILLASDDLVQFTRALQAEPQGRLKLTCASDFALVAANRWVTSYLQRWPQVAVEVDFTSRRIDLVHEGFDLALRIGRLDDSRLAARRLGELRYGLYASPAYLQRAGAPADPEALLQHPLLMFTTGSGKSGWRMVRRDASTEMRRIDAPGRVRAGSTTLLLDACVGGLGIARLPLRVAGAALARQQLVAVLPDWLPVPATVHAVFPSNRLLAPQVRAFIDHAVAAFDDLPAPSGR
jgi:DNA-binding transcriptional LysR family regulator